MGYSCRALAGNLLKTFESDGGKCSNVWTHNDQQYLWERGRESHDGAITGSIFRFVGTDAARRVGSFRISADGRIVRAPYGMDSHLHPERVADGLDDATKWILACEYDHVNGTVVVFSATNPYR